MRIGQGVGGAMLFANSGAIITDAFPENQRGLALGINSVAAIAGSFIGLILGGLLAPLQWRLVFLVSVPFGLFGTFWAYHKLRDLSARQDARIDWLGNITFAVGLIAVMVGITYGIQPYGTHTMSWTSPNVLAELIGGLAVLGVFCVIELRVPQPMFHLQLFRIRAFAAGNLASLLSAIGRGGLQFMLIIWLQGIWLPEHGYSFATTPLWAGHLHAAADGRLPDRRTGLRTAVGPLWCPPVRDGRHDRGGDLVPAARSAAGQLLLCRFRGGSPVERDRHGPIRVAQPGGDHEQPAAPPARRRSGDGRDVPEFGAWCSRSASSSR